MRRVNRVRQVANESRSHGKDGADSFEARSPSSAQSFENNSFASIGEEDNLADSGRIYDYFH